jgi:hypothetical protein
MYIWCKSSCLFFFFSSGSHSVPLSSSIFLFTLIYKKAISHNLKLLE